MSSSGYDRPGAGRYLWVHPQPLLLGRFFLHRASDRAGVRVVRHAV